MTRRIAILCSGGDVSGMNPALKRFVEYSFMKGLEPYFIQNGFEGLIDNKIVPASYCDVSGILNHGGTKIGSARSKRFMDASYRKTAADNLRSHGVSMLVVLGGDGSFRGMQKFYNESGIAFCGIPSTIDNDINGTDYCLGVDTALTMIRNGIDQIRDTASSFRRAFIIETMGRNCGYLALVSALTSGAELCRIPELSYDLDEYKCAFRSQIDHGRSYFIVIVSEALKQAEKTALWFEKELEIETRTTILGHTQRGGNPSVQDRLMAYRFVTCAIDALLSGTNDSVICYTASRFIFRSIEDVTAHPYTIEEELLSLAREQFAPVRCQR